MDIPTTVHTLNYTNSLSHTYYITVLAPPLVHIRMFMYAHILLWYIWQSCEATYQSQQNYLHKHYSPRNNYYTDVSKQQCQMGIPYWR